MLTKMLAISLCFNAEQKRHFGSFLIVVYSVIDVP